VVVPRRAYENALSAAFVGALELNDDFLRARYSALREITCQPPCLNLFNETSFECDFVRSQRPRIWISGQGPVERIVLAFEGAGSTRLFRFEIIAYIYASDGALSKQ